ncbi:MAG TPA: hypothetical protein VFG30_43975 [Polyangiales bacterium]|nr:hypothetical protein [Polyangiales bacterium]
MRRPCLASALSASLCAFTLSTSSPARAQAPTEGFGPDLQIAGGIGFGLDEKIDNNFLGRVRLGALYAFEPFWLSGGAAVEAGGLAGLAVGGELELNEFRGWFANLGVNYARNERITGHVGAGYTIFGLEYQHTFGDHSPSEALLFTVRFPLGFWWFTMDREERARTPPPSTPQSSPKLPPQQSRPLTPAASSGGTAQQPRPLGPTTGDPQSGRATAPTVVDPQTRERLERGQRALDEATVAGLRGDYAAQSDALWRAYTAQPDPLLFLRIADAEIARGKRALALDALQRFLASTATTDTVSVLSEKPNAQAKLNELQPQLARVRVTLDAAKGDEQVAIDGTPQPSALLGYDLWVDPGPHVLTVRSSDRPDLDQPFEAHAGELVRLAPSLPPPAAASQPQR